MKKDGTLGKMLPVRPLRVNGFLHKYQKYGWYQDGIFLEEHTLVGTFQFESTRRNKVKYPNTIEEKSGRNQRNKEEIRESTPPMLKRWFH